jgi:FAD/FMN-containing dehydrogenase
MDHALPAADALLAAFADAVGADGIRCDADSLRRYGADRAPLAAPAPLAIVLPADRDAVARALAVCHAHGIAVVPSGGRTGLSGGALAAKGEVVLATDRLRDVGPVDVVGRTIRVGAGVTNLELQQLLAPHGLQWPIDLASKGSATIGGNLATNAGGVRVLRYGHARRWVLGLEVVLADGSVLQLGGANEKDNTGLDLCGLFVGSEGVLGVITAATLKLTALPGPAEVALFALDDIAAALRLLAAARAAPATLSAFEVFDARSLAAVCSRRGWPAPFQETAPWYALCELEPAPGGDAAALEAWLAAVAMGEGVRAAALATDAAQRRAFWGYRESISECLAPDRPHKNDVCVPIAALGAFVEGLQRFDADDPGSILGIFGHLGDGNLHVNAQRARDAELFALVRRLGGSISAEHGIGLLKAPWIGLQHGAAELAAMRAVKAALDPRGLMNPGKMLAAEPSAI